MKMFIALLTIAFLPMSSQAAEVLCGISVQNSNIIYNRVGADVAFLRAILREEKAKWVECFNQHGAVVVATYKNGEVHAIIF